MLKVTGLAILILSVLGGFVLADGQLLSLWQPAQILIIAGGGLGAFLIANPWHVIRHTAQHLAKAIRGTNHYPAEYYQNLLTLLFRLFEIRRQAGVAALEPHIEEPEYSTLFMDSGILDNDHLTAFICDNLRLITLGKVLPHELEGLLDHELHTMADDLNRPADALQRIADSLPGFGIVAAVLGIVLTMQSMDGPAYLLGMNIAAALVGTFLGILLCYGLISPLAQSVTHSVRDEIQLYECVKAALLAKVSGRPSAIAADAGRRILYSEIRPSFVQLEGWLTESRE